MAPIEKVDTDLLKAAEMVVTTVRHVEPVRALAVELSRITGNAYACPDGCGQGAWPLGDNDAGYGIIGEQASAEHVHNNDMDSIGEGRH